MRWIYVRSTLKFNAKYVRSTPKFNAKWVRLALNALNLCKIYVEINAKYVRSTLKFNAKHVGSTPNFNAKYVRLALNALSLCKIYANFNAKYVRSTLTRWSYINSTHSTPILHNFAFFSVDTSARATTFSVLKLNRLSYSNWSAQHGYFVSLSVTSWNLSNLAAMFQKFQKNSSFGF